MIYEIKDNKLLKSSEIFDINRENTIVIVNSEEFSELVEHLQTMCSR